MKDLSKPRPEQGPESSVSERRAADTQRLESLQRRKEPAAVHSLAVDEAGAGQRIDNFLVRRLKGVPKSHIYRILRSGEVRVNSRRVKPDARLAPGDVLRIPPLRLAASPAI